MAIDVTPTTELEAVNLCLSVIGEVPVNTLDNIAFTDASIAQATIASVSRDTQSTGWYFNEDPEFTFAPDTGGNVILPANVLRVRPSTGEGRFLVPRIGGKLYNRDDQTYTFTADKPPVMYVVWGFAFDDLPQTFRSYIAIRAAKLFQTKVLGSDQLAVFTDQHEAEARAAIWREQSEYEPANMTSDDPETLATWSR